MNHRISSLVVLTLALGCSDSSTTSGNQDRDAQVDAGGPDYSTPAAKKALRKELLDASDDYSFDAYPDTISADCDVTLEATGKKQDADALIEAIEGSDSYTTICLSPGTYLMNKSIVISAASNITIKGIGKGPNDTVLDFAGHVGDKGFDVTTPGFWIENMWIKNTIGNGVEVKADGTADNPTVFRKLKVGWDIPKGAAVDCGEKDVRRMHGAYSVYPTKSKYVVVEFCEVEGASDAGLYIGQVVHGIVRHNKVHGNVAGLEVENSLDVVVYENDVYDNSGGILALQEPGLDWLSNEKVLIRNNQVHTNNGCNFAKPNATVASIPPGTGLMSFAGNQIEFLENVVTKNTTTGLLIVSNVLLNLLANEEPKFPKGYDPYAHEIYVNDNTFTDNATKLPGGDPGFVANAAERFKQVTWDGFRADDVPSAKDAKICLGNSKDSFVDITNDQCETAADTGAFLKCVMANHSNDTTAHTCSGHVSFTPF